MEKSEIIPTEKESNILKRVMLVAHKVGSTLFRNNVGFAKYSNGAVVKYGIANPGGSDLIGWTSVVVTEEMVGRTVAIFTAAETKTKTGRVTEEQNNFIDQVRLAGGIAGVVRSDDEFLSLVIEGEHNTNNL